VPVGAGTGDLNPGDRNPGERRRLGAAAVAGAATLWALIGLFTRRLSAHGVGPADVAFWRAAGGGACFVVHLVVQRWLEQRRRGDGSRDPVPMTRAMRSWSRSTWTRLIVFCLLGVFVFYRALPSAVVAGSIAMAYVLLYTAPIWVVAAVAISRRRIEGRVVALAAVTVAGAALVVLGVEGSGALRWAGVGWGLVAGASYASYYLVGRPLFFDIGAIAAYAIALPVGALLLAPFARFPHLDASSRWSILGLVVISTWLPYVLLSVGLRYLQPDRAVIVATLEPVVAAAIGWSLYGERIAWFGLCGGAMVIAAAVAANRGSATDDTPGAHPAGHLVTGV